jgi:hypothetical protein
MLLDSWDVIGDPEMTEHWRRVVPALSVDVADDQTGDENNRARVAAVRQRYALELKHLTRTEQSSGFVHSQLTRLSDWSPLTDKERRDTRAGSPFALCRGVPSGLRVASARSSDTRCDFAIVISVPPPFVPFGALILDGVPLVVHRFRPFRPLPGNADELLPTESTIPSYSI